jgi:hypothetical protein
MGGIFIDRKSLPDVPVQTRMAAAEAEIERQRLMLINNRDILEGISVLKDSYLGALNSLIGSDTFDQCRSIRQQTNDQMQESAKLFVPSTVGQQAENEYRKRLLSAEKNQLDDLDVDWGQVEELKRKIITEAIELLKKKGFWSSAAEGYAEQNQKHESVVYSLFSMEPPFVDAWGKCSGCVDGNVFHEENRETGTISERSRISVSRPLEDPELLITKCYSEVRFWYSVKATGVLSARIRLKPLVRQSKGYYIADNNTSFFEGHYQQLSTVYLDVVYPKSTSSWQSMATESLLDIDRHHKTSPEVEDRICSWSADYGMSPVEIQMETPGVFKKGTMALIAVGIRDTNIVVCHGVEGHQDIRSHYMVSHVDLESSK